MSEEAKFIGSKQWLDTPVGRYLLDWEQREVDEAVADLFGFHAVQLGFPELDSLRANRMPHRWMLAEAGEPDDAGATPAPKGAPALPARAAVVLRCDFDALPFPSNSIDLVVMPHSLELARDAHLALREAERVLVPEGRLVILGLNPRSMWGFRHRVGQLRRLMASSAREPFLATGGESIGYRRLRDWLRLLSFEVEAGRFGCYRPPLRSEKWLARWAWIERIGDRWWPVFGAVYMVVAVKRVRGMRLIGLARKKAVRGAASPAVATSSRNNKISK